MFSLKWGDVYFNVEIREGRAVKSFFSEKPAFEFLDCKYSRQLDRYFRGMKKVLNIPYRLEVSEFVRRVLAEVKKIPYGKTASYSEIANLLGTSPRGVGQALKRNPLPVIIPCHSVVGKNGLGGYSYGTNLKEKLLRLEGSF